MKWISLLWLILLAPTRQMHTYYFPSFFTMPNTGIAWYATPHSSEHADMLGAYWFYNSSSYANDDNRAIPIARQAYYWDMVHTMDRGYDGYMLVGNEGEGRGQDDMTPQAMADFIRTINRLYPHAYLICLNSYDLNYMLAVIELLPADICHAYGVHVTYLVEGSVSSWLDNLCFDCEIWVTEIGWPNDDPQVYDRLFSLVEGARDDPRVRFIFAYTTSEGHIESINMIGQGGELLTNGRAFVDAIGAYP